MKNAPTRPPYKYGQFIYSFCAKCRTEFMTNYATVICGACQHEPKEYGVLAFLPNGQMMNHGHYHTSKESEAAANALRSDKANGRIVAFKLIEAHLYLD